jgi:LysM repeat protein
MTREHKLALVVGFGLILIVGILISDHFSTTARLATADLSTTTDGLSQNRNKQRQRTPDLIEVYPAAVNLTQLEATASTPVASMSNSPTTSTPVARLASNVTEPTNPRQLRTPNLQQLARTAAPTNAMTTSADFDFYQVRSGDSLTSICRGHYGDANMVKNVARYNGLSNANQLRLNHRLRLPKVSVVLGETVVVETTRKPRTQVSTSNTGQKNGYTTYKVVPGDTFSELTQKLMGSVSHMDAFLKINQATISNPDQLRVGMVLRYPAAH